MSEFLKNFILDKYVEISCSFYLVLSGLQLKIQQDNIIEIHTAPSCIMAREASERRYNRNTVAFDLVQVSPSFKQNIFNYIFF